MKTNMEVADKTSVDCNDEQCSSVPVMMAMAVQNGKTSALREVYDMLSKLGAITKEIDHKMSEIEMNCEI